MNQIFCFLKLKNAIIAILLSLTFVSAFGDNIAAMTQNAINDKGQTTITDGSAIFEKLFENTGMDCAIKVSYEINRNFSANETAANGLKDALSKAQAENKDNQQTRQMADAYIQKLKNGYKNKYYLNIYLSPKGKVFLERIDKTADKEWITRTYFTNGTIVEVKPAEHIAKILPANYDAFPELLSQFPILYKCIGFNPERISAFASGGLSNFTIIKKGVPYVLWLRVNSTNAVESSGAMSYQKTLLRSSVFNYSEKWPKWPSTVTTDVFASNGTPILHEIWQLADVKALEANTSFEPVVDKDTVITDKSGSAIPTDEINRILEQ